MLEKWIALVLVHHTDGSLSINIPDATIELFFCKSMIFTIISALTSKSLNAFFHKTAIEAPYTCSYKV